MTEQTEQAPYESWDAFWSEVEAEAGPPRTEVIRGVEVVVPTSLPLRFARRLDQLQNSDRFEDIAELLTELFGQTVVDRWVDAGMGLLEVQVIFAWAVAHAGGQPITFRQAYEKVRERTQDKDAGKAVASSTSRSAGTGGRSKRTSAASTT